MMSSNIVELENQLPGVASWGIGKGLEGKSSLQVTIYPNCIQQNQSINIYCASTENDDTLKIEIFRLGWYSSSGSRPIITLSNVGVKNDVTWLKTNVMTKLFRNKSNDYLNSALDSWEKSVEINVDETWTPGIYHARVTNKNGLKDLHPFWIFNSDSKSNGIMIFPNISNQKLNSYGNYPIRKEEDYSMIRPFSNSRYGEFFKWCQPVVSKLERIGLDYVQVTDEQLDLTPELLENKEVMICCGDFRYWTKKMVESARKFVLSGGRIISFEGNLSKKIIELNSNGKVIFSSEKSNSFDIKYELANLDNIENKLGFSREHKAKNLREEAIKHFSKLNWDIVECETIPDKKPITENQLFKITILTCVWKRPELTQCVLSYYQKLKEELKEEFEINLLAIGSEGKKSKIACQNSGFDYVEYQNKPLSDKWEIGINECKKYESDAVIIVGSDDLLSRETIQFLSKKIKEGQLVVGLKDMYLYDSSLMKLYHWQGYENDPKQSMNRGLESIGMGRCISRKLLEKLDYSIWKDMKIDKGLDGAMTRKFSQVGVLPIDQGKEVWMLLNDGKKYAFGHVAFEMQETGGIAVDIKTSENVTAISKYHKIEVDNTLLKKFFREESIYNSNKK